MMTSADKSPTNNDRTRGPAISIEEQLARLPREPGVYLLKDHGGEIIYIGKAKNLSSRVRSYFNRSGHDTRAFVPLLGRLLGEIESIVTVNAKEALLLENNLIKQHRPRFNVMMRDDKAFLVLRLDVRKAFPRLEVTRRIADDGARYFGPFHSASACRETLRVVNRHFQLRTCSDRAMITRSRPCLQFQIGRCLAPCVDQTIDPEVYATQVEDVSLFLRGREEDLIASLEQRMRGAAAELNYEHAARIRDQIAAVRRSLQGQHVVGAELIDRDVFAFYREADAVDFAVLNLRQGKLVGRRSFAFDGQEFPDEELLSSFVNQFYDAGADVPAQVLLCRPVEDEAAKAQWLGELRGGRVEVLVPQRGDKRRLVELAWRNAEHTFKSRRQRSADIEQSLAKLELRLRLRRPPRRIECYDVSGMHGQLVVASLVVLQDGEPEPASYRHFKVDVSSGGRPAVPVDDFAALYQVLARRLRRAREGDGAWRLPDLIVVDGGKGQLSVALAALKDAKLDPHQAPDLVALAKARDDEPDRAFLPRVKDPVRLRANTAELLLLSRVRDEAHRFAITHHKKLRRRRSLRSGLDDIPGIGPKRRKELLRTLGSLKRVREATVDQLASVPSMSRRAAEAVARYFADSSADVDPAGHSSGQPAGDPTGDPTGQPAGDPPRDPRGGGEQGA